MTDDDRFTEHLTDDTPAPDAPPEVEPFDQVASIEPVDVHLEATGPAGLPLGDDAGIRQPAPTAPRSEPQGETINPWDRAQERAEAPPVTQPAPNPALPLETLADAQAAENTTPPPAGYPFPWGGRTWRVKPQFDVRAVASLQSGDIGRALGLLLGKEQGAELMAWDAPDGDAFTDEILGEMIQVASGAKGLSLPES